MVKSVPIIYNNNNIYKKGARRLLDKIRENRDVLDRNDKDELVYENKPINGSHVVDLINDMLRRRKGFESMGWSVFARGLAA